MFAAVAPSSPIALAVLIFCFVLVLAFEFSNGFHDTANAVATVIDTHSLRPVPAVLLSGTMNFLGVVLGGVAVAFTLVELLPPDVLTPPNGNPAIAMLLALFLGALLWNVAIWWLGIPCSSSHAIIGSLLGVAVVNSITASRGLGQGVDWSQVWSVLRALFVSPLLGFFLAGALFRILQVVISDRTLFVPAEGRPPPWWGSRAADPDLLRRQLRARLERRSEEHRADHVNYYRHHAGGVFVEPGGLIRKSPRHCPGRGPGRAADPEIRR
jgi:PiT family inorganic phosphate transporter